jgi:hypothetical protein
VSEVNTQLVNGNNQNAPSVAEVARQARVGWEYARGVIDNTKPFGEVMHPLHLVQILACAREMPTGFLLPSLARCGIRALFSFFSVSLFSLAASAQSLATFVFCAALSLMRFSCFWSRAWIFVSLVPAFSC